MPNDSICSITLSENKTAWHIGEAPATDTTVFNYEIHSSQKHGFLRLTGSGGYADHAQPSALSKSYTPTSHPDMTIRFVGWLSRTISLISQSFFFRTGYKDDPTGVQLNVQKKAIIRSKKIAYVLQG